MIIYLILYLELCKKIPIIYVIYYHLLVLFFILVKRGKERKTKLWYVTQRGGLMKEMFRLIYCGFFFSGSYCYYMPVFFSAKHANVYMLSGLAFVPWAE